MFKIIEKFVRLSASAERAALDIYERLPLSLRYRVFYGSAFVRWLAFLKESENWDKDRIYAYQFEQTKNLLIHAMRYVPHYRNLFSVVGFNPDKIQNLDDLRQIPYLAKESVRDNSTQFIDERIPLNSLFKRPTSGSCGIPMIVYQCRENRATFLAFRVSILRRIGHTPKAREVMLWPYVQLGKKSVPFMRYGNRLALSINYLSGEWLLKYLDMIRKFEPEYILGYSSALTFLATVIKHNNLSAYRNIKAIIAYSENLNTWQRKLIEESFGSRVFSMYAMTEQAVIGGECEYISGLHLHPLYGLVDFDDTMHGYQEIVATGFTNYAMPFIRYRTGDVVSECGDFCNKCGRYHKIVGNIEGRTHEFLVGREKELILIQSSWIGIYPNVLQYQFFQEEPGKVYFKMVPSKVISDADKYYIRQKLGEIFGRMKGAMDIELVFVDDIVRTSSGKIKLVDQKLDIYAPL